MKNTDIIDLLGGVKVVADILNISPPAVCVWRKRGVPKEKLMFLAATIEQKTNGQISRKTLFPEHWGIIWPELKKEA